MQVFIWGGIRRSQVQEQEVQGQKDWSVTTSMGWAVTQNWQERSQLSWILLLTSMLQEMQLWSPGLIITFMQQIDIMIFCVSKNARVLLGLSQAGIPAMLVHSPTCKARKEMVPVTVAVMEPIRVMLSQGLGHKLVPSCRALKQAAGIGHIAEVQGIIAIDRSVRFSLFSALYWVSLRLTSKYRRPEVLLELARRTENMKDWREMAMGWSGGSSVKTVVAVMVLQVKVWRSIWTKMNPAMPTTITEQIPPVTVWQSLSPLQRTQKVVENRSPKASPFFILLKVFIIQCHSIITHSLYQIPF